MSLLQKNVVFISIMCLLLEACSVGVYRSFDAALRHPQKVVQLKISYKKIDSIPEAIFSLPNVQHIYFFKNQLTEIPPEIGRLKTLKSLVVSSNQLTEVPAEIGNLQRLERLSLSNNYLKELPPEIGKLQRLHELELQMNDLQQLPESLGNLSQLAYVNLSNNGIENLPDSLQNWQNIKFVYIGRNNLQEIPQWIVQWQNLVELDLRFSGNGLQIPAQLAQIRSLEKLYIDYTAIVPNNLLFSNPRLQIIQTSPNELMDYGGGY
ncbi:MAG: leucine-rich repeat domain-containing protein [Chitinophagales bacterium]|nr:leucine-rich repeat domain-containing protein [Chitinophagales bacterium]